MTLQMDDIRPTSTAEVFAGDLRACLSRMHSKRALWSPTETTGSGGRP